MSQNSPSGRGASLWDPGWRAVSLPPAPVTPLASGGFNGQRLMSGVWAWLRWMSSVDLRALEKETSGVISVKGKGKG